MTNEKHFSINVALWIKRHGRNAPAEFERMAKRAGNKAEADHFRDLAKAAQAELLSQPKSDDR